MFMPSVGCIASSQTVTELFSDSCSSLSGWSTRNSPTVDNTIGNPTPSFKTLSNTTSTSRAAIYKSPTLSGGWAGKTLQFDALIASAASGAIARFACDTSGNGLALAISTSAGNTCTVSRVTSNPNVYATSSAAIATFANTDNAWHRYKIVCKAGAIIDVYVDDNIVLSNINMTSYAAGDILAFCGSGGNSNAAYWDNILITSP